MSLEWSIRGPYNDDSLIDVEVSGSGTPAEVMNLALGLMDQARRAGFKIDDGHKQVRVRT